MVERPFYIEKERAALAWAEALTVIKSGLVPADIFEEARIHFSETELVDLKMAVIAINAYNRINIAFGSHAGTVSLLRYLYWSLPLFHILILIQTNLLKHYIETLH